MIKIIEKEVAIKLVVEPEITNLYYAHGQEERVIKIHAVIFRDIFTTPEDYVISYLTDTHNIYYVTVNKETKEVKDCSECFYDLEEAKKQYLIKRKVYCENAISSYKKSLTDVKRMIKHFQSELEKIKKENENETN